MQDFEDMQGYLEWVGRFCESGFGQRFRGQFRDLRGTAELAMLAAPSKEEYEDFCRVVEVMTAAEKEQPEKLSDEQIKDLAARAGANNANVSIFINGYVLARQKAGTNQKRQD